MKKDFTKYAMRQISKKHVPKSLKCRFENNNYSQLLNDVYRRAAELFEENASASKALQVHLNEILPCIAFYEILQKENGKEKALELYDEWAFDELEKTAVKFRKIMKLGIYKIAPFIFDKSIDKFFGPAAGFKNNRVEDSVGFARDMVVCPYVETCKKYGCPELTQFFCKSDDVVYSELHPKLVWNRTKTLGRGGDCCDFRLYLKRG